MNTKINTWNQSRREHEERKEKIEQEPEKRVQERKSLSEGARSEREGLRVRVRASKSPRVRCKRLQERQLSCWLMLSEKESRKGTMRQSKEDQEPAEWMGVGEGQNSAEVLIDLWHGPHGVVFLHTPDALVSLLTCLSLNPPACCHRPPHCYWSQCCRGISFCAKECHQTHVV